MKTSVLTIVTVVVIIILVFISSTFISQNKNLGWKILDKEPVIYKYLTLDSTEFKVQDIKFVAVWKDSVSYSSNLGYLRGLKSLKIYNNEKLVNIMYQIKDQIALQEFVFIFYDYNFDGYLDFSFRRECGKSCYFSYFVFDKVKNKFIHAKEWDYIGIYQINPKKHLIETYQDGLEDNREVFKVRGIELIKTN